ncbi:MAG: DUF2269 domain-containing protein [Gammaproteobacteria bacterium]|nr:DUF2269 domain-containing protein [Gammaproteobacteria bacterium]
MPVALKSLHILGACLFLGNIIVSAFWKVLADRTGNYSVIRFATRLVNITDTVFTGLGATLLLVTGHVLAGNYGGIYSNGWILWSYVLFGISGAIWVAVLVPIQFKQAQILRVSTIEEIPKEYHRLARLWSLAGTLATLFPLPAVYLMVSRGG